MEANVYLIGLSFLVVLWLAFFIFSKRDVPKIGLLLLGASPLFLLYLFNPNLRIYSVDGFRHAGIVYQLLQGSIPPLDPLLAGQVLQQPWGWHCVAALITKLFNITPFYSFAIINLLSFYLTMILVYKISRSAVKEEKANIFSVLISIFAITLYTQISTAVRGVPLFETFTNSNAVPLGLVFFLLALYALVKFFQNKNLWGNLLLFFIALLGGGFLSPAFLTGILVATILLCLVTFLFPRYTQVTRDLKKIVLLTCALGLGILCLSPYLLSLTPGIRGQTQLFNLQWMSVKIVRYVAVILPLLIIIFFNRRYLQDNLDRTALTVLLTVVMATLGCYIFISMPLETESTYFILSTVLLGIVGGIAFHSMNQRLYKAVVFIIVLLFLVPLSLRIQKQFFFQNDYLPVLERYGEKGPYLYSTTSEENELYEWIRNSTDKDSTFIDVKLDIPVLAQRQLLIGMDRGCPLMPVSMGKGMKGLYSGEPGYSSTIDSFLRSVNCYDPELIDRRQKVVKRLYNPGKQITDAESKELENILKNVYVVDRTQALADNLNREGFNQMFRSSQGQFLVFQLDHRKVSDRLSRREDDSEKRDGKGIGTVSIPSEYENRLLEAEYADTIGRPLEVADDKEASQGTYIYAPDGTGNSYTPGTTMALYSVYIIQPGDYVLWGRVRAAGGKSDSFFVQIDIGANNLWDIVPSDKWHWAQVTFRDSDDPVKFPLTEGLHTIKIKVREAGAKLDQLLLTNNVNFVPGGSVKQGGK